MNKLIGLIISLFTVAVVATSTYAAGSSTCQPIYGGGEVCRDNIKFTINKLVQKPGKAGGEFVENLTINDPRYSPNQNVNFKIVIENTGDRDITNLNVVDRFPQFLTFVAGVANSNVGASEINFVVGTLKKGQKVEYVITAKTATEDKLPANQAITCVTNNVKATSNDGASAEDNSQVCIEKEVTQPTQPGQPGQPGKGQPVIQPKPVVEKIPSTGPEIGILAGLVPMLAAGFYLRRKTN